MNKKAGLVDDRFRFFYARWRLPLKLAGSFKTCWRGQRRSRYNSTFRAALFRAAFCAFASSLSYKSP